MRTVPGETAPASTTIGGPSVGPPVVPPVAAVLPPLPPPSLCDPSPPFTLQAANARQNSAAPHPLGPNSPIRTEPPGPKQVSIQGDLVQITPGTQPERAGTEDVTRVMRENADQEPDT